MKKLVTATAVAAIVLVIAACSVFIIWDKNCRSFLNKTLVSGEYIIERGSSYPQIYAVLFGGHEAPKFFSTYLIKVKKIDRTLHYGYYEADNISLDELLANVTAGKQTLLKVTFPEGYNMYDVAAALECAGIASGSDALAVFKDRAVVAELTGNSYESLEGFLAPGTYFFHKNHSPLGIARKMVSEFYEFLPVDYEARAKAKGLSFYDALTLASIVQKETYSDSEAPVVAAVFLNRIKAKMLLQADPTIIYGLYEGFDGNIRKKDINDASNRYNTYKHKGLTPTPISNPSVTALMAVIEPANVDYYYFVAKQGGGHVFAKNYEEHRKNVRMYQLGASN